MEITSGVRLTGSGFFTAVLKDESTLRLLAQVTTSEA
jgi:hypothetical protein